MILHSILFSGHFLPLFYIQIPLKQADASVYTVTNSTGLGTAEGLGDAAFTEPFGLAEILS